MKEVSLEEWCAYQLKQDTIIEIPEEMFKLLDNDQVNYIVDILGGKKLITLPKAEIEFFEWLKVNDPNVWNDIWVDEIYDPYIVSINMLPDLVGIDNDRGFPICDLVNCDNYYFSLDFMQDEESKIVIDSAQERLLDKEKLTTAQKLALEIYLAPIDIWHFAYKYRISLDEAKAAVIELVEDDALVHLKEYEFLHMALASTNKESDE